MADLALGDRAALWGRGVVSTEEGESELRSGGLSVAAGGMQVLVGRVRKDLASDRLWLWQVSDNLRKGAATNAVQIAEIMLERGLV